MAAKLCINETKGQYTSQGGGYVQKYSPVQPKATYNITVHVY